MQAAFLKRHYGGASGVILVVMGVLLVTGALFRLKVEAQQVLDGAGA